MTLGFSLPPCPESPLRCLDARWKLAAFVLALIALGFLGSLLPALSALAGCLFLILLGRVPIRWYLSRMGMLMLFLAPFALTLPLLTPGDSWLPGLRLALLLTTKALAMATM